MEKYYLLQVYSSIYCKGSQRICRLCKHLYCAPVMQVLILEVASWQPASWTDYGGEILLNMFSKEEKHDLLIVSGEQYFLIYNGFIWKLSKCTTQWIFLENLRWLTQMWTSDSWGIRVFPNAKILSSFLSPWLPLFEVTKSIPCCSKNNWHQNKLYVNK